MSIGNYNGREFVLGSVKQWIVLDAYNAWTIELSARDRNNEYIALAFWTAETDKLQKVWDKVGKVLALLNS